MILFSQPLHGVQRSLPLTQLELKDALAAYRAKCLTSVNRLSTTDADRTEVSIDGVVAAVTYNNSRDAGIAEHLTNLAIEDTTYGSTRLTLQVDTLVIKTNVLQSLHVILSKAVDHLIGTADSG